MRWDARYAQPGWLMGEAPRPLLVEVADQLPKSGCALDLACGEGQNAVFLARRGLAVDAVDISPVALEKARQLAGALPIDFHEVDLDGWRPAREYDLIVCMHYLDRALFRELRARMIVGEWPLGLRRFPVDPAEPPSWFPGLTPRLLRHDDKVVQLVAVRE